MLLVRRFHRFLAQEPSTKLSHISHENGLKTVLWLGEYEYAQHAQRKKVLNINTYMHKDTDMKRREFLASSGLLGLATVGGMTVKAKGASGGQRDFYELREYQLETAAQKAEFDAFMQAAAIPALNRIGVKPVGVFYPMEGISPVRVLLRHRSLDSMTNLIPNLASDQEFVERGAEFLEAPSSNPAYKRMESNLMIAFKCIPQLECPISKPGRIFQLRVYESPSVVTGQKKIEMFNIGEVEIFRKTGLHPVFFGETIIGANMPNLTYMLVFNDMEERKKNWRRFVTSPEWKELSSKPEYADKRILCNITNTFLKPADYSQI
jgi:hypothetical protein